MATSNHVVDKNKIPSIYLGNRKITVLKSDSNLLQSFKNQQIYREDLIYESKSGDFLNSSENICIVNRHNLTSNFRQTLVRKAGGSEVLKTSDDIVRLIGQQNYDLVFSAISSVFSLELKVRGILALLTARRFNDICVQTNETKNIKTCVDVECQTNENCMDLFFKKNKRKRIKRQTLTPYVVKDDKPPSKTVKKIVIQPDEFCEFQKPDASEGGSTLPVLVLHDEDSNTSIGNMSSLSANTIPLLLENPTAILDNIPMRTEPDAEQTSTDHCPTTLTMLDGTFVTLSVKPEDDLHIATSDILNNVNPEQRCKLKLLQAFYDWKYCLEKDEDGNLPIHIAVNNDDMELLRRQCLVLTMRKESVDIEAGDRTALQMSLYQKDAAATELLLKYGADPLKTDAENRTCVHLAAEEGTEHLRAIIKHCRDEPLSILRENEELCNPGIESMTKEEQADHLLDKICRMTDNQGYTPLMLASKLGLYENVAALLDAAPKTVNLQMPNSGNTALYVAVSAACMDASDRGNLQKVADKYLKIVGKLVENGADPSLDNHAGHNVNILLTEFNVGDLSQVIANKMTAINCYNFKVDSKKELNNLMLVKDKQGAIKVEEIRNKPIILENVRVDTKIDNKKLVVSKIVPPPVANCFVGTFRNFIKNDSVKASTVSKIDLTKKSMVVIKDNYRVRKRKVITDAAPAKISKVKTESDGDEASGSKNK